MPTQYDTFAHGLSPDVAPSGAFPLAGSIQPSAEIAHATQFLTPPLADRAYAAAYADSTSLVPGVGETGAIVLRQAGITAASEALVPCWYWFKLIGPTFGLTAPDFLYGISHLVEPAIAPIGAQVPGLVTNFSPSVAKLQPFGIVVGTLGLATAFEIFAHVSAAAFATDHPWVGPFFKPQGIAVMVRGVIGQTDTEGCFRWLEIPNPR